jgi:aryl-alcohol dehydrogenase-like predicted oxidoreductase
MTSTYDIGVTAWLPLVNGLLTGKYNIKKDKMQQQLPQRNVTSPLNVVAVGEDNNKLNRLKYMSTDFVDGLLNDSNIVIAKEVKNISKEIGYSPEQVALN